MHGSLRTLLRQRRSLGRGRCGTGSIARVTGRSVLPLRGCRAGVCARASLRSLLPLAESASAAVRPRGEGGSILSQRDRRKGKAVYPFPVLFLGPEPTVVV